MARTLVRSLRVLAVLCFIASFFPPSMSLTVETEALIQFKSQLKDPLGILDSWKDSADSPCQFSGITCDPVTEKVTEISLDNKSLSGEISPSISVLDSLTKLWLPSNHISGKLPSELGNCSNLKVLNVTGNYMFGVIPDLSMLKNLEILDLSSNGFRGRFPSWVANLTGLNLFFELKELDTLDISVNAISGTISRSVSNLRQLSKIEAFGNNLTGEIPRELAELTLLREIDISNNQMSGELPEGFGNLKNLTVFQCYKNNFYGKLPSGFGDMQHLIGFSIYENSFSGEFPASFGRYSPLESIDISENQFLGSFPKFLCEGRKLQALLALNNNFSGEVSDSYGKCKTLERLRINKNRLSGKVPDGLWALPKAKMIDFGDNNFIGGISPNISFSTSLSQLILQNNRFSGALPSGLGKLSNLERLILHKNNFSGEIPSEIGALKQLSFLHLEDNSLTGSIPMELGYCTKLVDLNLAWNLLRGNIPSTFSQLSSLNALNLSENKLTGLIPDSFRRLKLSSIDMSENQLSGSVPSYLLRMGGDKAFIGNKGLCLDQSTKTLMNSGLDVCPRKHSQKKFKNTWVLFCIIAAALMVVLAGLLLVSYKNFMLEADMQNDLDEEKEVDPKWKLASFHQMDIDADEICNLDEDNLIGIGGTGKVYRLDLKKNGGTVAVKQLWKSDGVKVLAAEMGILGKIRHRNILKLYACLVKGGSNFLVFEYMANEMAYTYKVTEKSDVYSFGVVLLELVTGRRPIEDEYGDGRDIVYWVSIHLNNRENVLKVLDNEVASESIQEDMIKVLKIGVLCTSKLPSLRPSMREVIKMLCDADPGIFKSPESGLEKSGKIIL
ncbi:hypothetical protein Pint_07374 [Pistacia integerrima]|uniref:Uncharacterized protein n=1 Tax=Pistacia integerrima TaxID=434235 RepID=A0ACC0Y0E5_9ROSI|nr:hypothetical protein Pint_07374 [Pistacia integerrima]